MLLDFLRSLIVFHGVALGLAWPLAVRLKLAPAERLVAGVALSLLGTFLVAWGVYVFALPPATLFLLVVTSVAGLVFERRALAETWRDADARAMLVGYLLVAGWCTGLLATIDSYSGGGWAGDWLEHWERTRFFLERGPLDQPFLTVYSLTARPPLVNVVTAALLSLTRADFAHYQLVGTLLAALVFLPTALLARRFCPPGRGPRVIALLAVLFLVNPLVAENATFAWTKLPTACFVLAAWYFFLRARDADAPRRATLLWASFLAAALLAHYSAGPYAVMLALAWLAFPRDRRDAAWWRATGLAAAAGAFLLALWFGWAVAHYGVRGTFLSNTSVTQAEGYDGSQLAKIALNLRDTLVPAFLRHPSYELIQQTNPIGRLRDACFLAYQLNLPLAFGCIAWLAVARELFLVGRAASRSTRNAWLLILAGVTFLGIATHGARDEWGLTHICLQALVLLGLAFLAARWTELGAGWRRALLAGAVVDLALGIGLQFGVQSFRLVPAEAVRSLSVITRMNLLGKFQNHLQFFGEAFGAPPALMMLLLGVVLAAALARLLPGGHALIRRIAPPTAPLRTGHDLPLEGLRGLCAFAVFYAHAFAPSPVLDPRWAPPPQFWWLNLGHAAVMVFFTLSGYVIGLTTTRAPSGPEVKRYLGRRALRLVPINTFAVLLAWAFLPVVDLRTVAGNLLFLENGDPYPGGTIFAFMPNNIPLWSLNCEAAYYLLFLAVWVLKPSRLLMWGAVAAIALLSAAGLTGAAIVSHLACGALYWLAGLALAWQSEPVTGRQRGNWPAALLGAIALWLLGPLRSIVMGAGWFSLLAVTPSSVHRLDYLLGAIWVVASVTGRAPRLQRIAGWATILWGLIGVFLRWRAGPLDGADYVATTALAGALVLQGWRPEATALARLAPLGIVSFAVYAIASPLQLGQRAFWPEFSGSPLTFAARFVVLLAVILALAWGLERRLAPWLRRRFLGARAVNFPRETAAPLNPVR